MSGSSAIAHQPTPSSIRDRRPHAYPPTYVHVLAGRVRIKLREVKGSPASALEIERQIQAADGVSHAKANPLTGSVLVLYDPLRTGQQEIVGLLLELGCRPDVGRDGTARNGHVGERVARAFVQSTVEMALQSIIRSLI